VILIVCLGAPLVEAFDRWDDTLHDGNDTEANFVIAALCVGLALSVAGTVVAWIRARSSRVTSRAVPSTRAPVTRVIPAAPSPTASPPIALRV